MALTSLRIERRTLRIQNIYTEFSVLLETTSNGLTPFWKYTIQFRAEFLLNTVNTCESYLWMLQILIKLETDCSGSHLREPWTQQASISMELIFSSFHGLSNEDHGCKFLVGWMQLIIQVGDKRLRLELVQTFEQKWGQNVKLVLSL